MTGIGTLVTISVCCTYVCLCPVLTAHADLEVETRHLPEKPPDAAVPAARQAGPDLTFYPAGMDYCNLHNIHRHEGLAFHGYTLRQLHIVLSPGESSPIIDATDHGIILDPSPCHLHTGELVGGKTASFTEAALLYKTVHDNKHAFKQFHPVIRSDCRGEPLTAHGYKQLISVGEHLFTSFFGDPLKTKLSLAAESIHAESIAEPLPYQSLIAFLHGLLPEKQFSRTDVVKTSDNLCSLRHSARTLCHCPYISSLAGPVDQALHRGRYMFKDAFPYDDILRSLFPDLSTAHLSSIELYRLLLPGVCSGQSLACDGHGSCTNVTMSNMALLAGLASKFLRRMAGDTTFRRFADVYTYPFLARLLHAMEEFRRPPTIHVYSGHRRFLPLLLDSLGLTVDTVRPLASRVVFELYQRNRNQPDGGALYIRMLYNGEDVTGRTEPCGGHIQDGLCPLHRWADWLDTRGLEYQDTCTE